MKINGWPLLMREKIDDINLVESLKTKLSTIGFETIEDRENVRTFHYEIPSDHPHIQLSIQLTYSKANDRHVELIASLEGQEWDETISKKYVEIHNQLTKTYFKNNAKKYTCIELINNGIIERDYILKALDKSLNINYHSTQIDTVNNRLHKEYIYGHTSLWDGEIIIDDRPINVQLVIDKNDQTMDNIIIGTPILMTEY